MIELKNINKKYKQQQVLNNCNLKFIPGNIYLIKGKSGSGKTTLLNIISGLDVNYDGNVFINNIDYKKMTYAQKNKYQNNISYLMQKNLYYKKMTIRENMLIINNDNDVINKLANKLGIADIIDKKPTDVSGGELQRASLLRMLLFNPKILILDEPTSNLDHENSVKFAKMLENISTDGRIIIISTHKNVFDNLANQIININYGNIKLDNKNINTKEKKINFDKQKFKPNMLKFGLKNIYKENLILKVFSICVILLSLIAFSYFFNYKNEYLKNSIKDATYHVIDVNEEKKEEIAKHYTINNEYYDYRYEEGFYHCYTLLPYNDSTLKAENVIFLGNYPQNNNEVLINAQMAKSLPNVNISNYDGAIGSVLNINGKDYIISGIIGEDNIDYMRMYISDVLYSSIVEDSQQPYSAIFIPYEEISQFGVKNGNKVLISLDKNDLIDVYNLDDFNMSLFHDSVEYGIYGNIISNTIAKTESPTKAAIIIAIMVTIVSFFFLLNEVDLELYFRQREIGFLKLMHFNKNNISTIFILEYMFNYCINIIISIILYFISMIILKNKLGFYITLDISYLIIIIAFFLIYSYTIMDLSIRKYLKKDTVDLLKS